MKMDWRRVVLYVTVLGVESCWLYAWMALLNKQVAEGKLAVSGLLLLYPVAFVFNLLLSRVRWPRACNWGVCWVGWIVAMLLTVKTQMFAGMALSNTEWLLATGKSIPQVIYGFRPELLILLSTAVIWWLGRRISYTRVDFRILVSEFQFGILLLVIAFFSTSQLVGELSYPIPLTLAFFMFALTGISIAHGLEGTSWLSGLNQGHWFGLLLIAIGLILAVGFLIGLAVTPDLLQLFVTAIKWVWGLVVKALAFLASLLPGSEPAEPPPPPTTPMPDTGASEGFNWSIPESVRSGLSIALGIFWLGLMIVALWRLSSEIFSWMRRRLAGMGGAEVESMPGAFRADLKNLLKMILSRLLNLRLPFRLKGRGRVASPETESVRQIYRQLLRWSAAAGYPRHISQTPYEFLSSLEGVVPEAQNELEAITQQYVRTRYGASSVTGEELQRLKQTWHNVKRTNLKKRRK
ncbi:MAG: DUF4129 domain-containing protein [Dehalococcoidia bacterium]